MEKTQCNICGAISESVVFTNPLTNQEILQELVAHKMGCFHHPSFYIQLMQLIQEHFDKEGEMK